MAFYAGSNKKNQKGKSGKKSDKVIECFNCHKKGHKKADCWWKGGGKEGQGPRSKVKKEEVKKETASVAEEEGVWMAIANISDDEEMNLGDSKFYDFTITKDEEFFFSDDEQSEDVMPSIILRLNQVYKVQVQSSSVQYQKSP